METLTAALITALFWTLLEWACGWPVLGQVGRLAEWAGEERPLGGYQPLRTGEQPRDPPRYRTGNPPPPYGARPPPPPAPPRTHAAGVTCAEAARALRHLAKRATDPEARTGW